MAVFTRQQAERDMEQGRRARRPYEPCRCCAGVADALSEASTSHTLSPKEKLMNIISMTLLTLLLLPLPGWSTDLNLFVIQRSKNTNEVQYRLHVNDHCQIVSDHPVRAFWHLREVSPEHTEPLSDLEHMAYGVTNQKVDLWLGFFAQHLS